MVPPVEGPAAELARRLRDLRVHHWQDKITQKQLADAFASSGPPPSVPSISSWENPENPALPPVHRLESYATFFATSRSVERRPYRVLDLSELTPSELATREQLLTDLTALHTAAKSGTAPGSHRDSVLSFAPGEDIVLVCPPIPAEDRKKMPQPDPFDPDRIDLYDYGDLDALLALYGRLSALNPHSLIQRVRSDRLTYQQRINHLVILGGVEVNPTIRDLVERREWSAPIRQIGRGKTTENPGGFEVEKPVSANNDLPTFEPQVLDIDGQSQVSEDVAEIHYGPNPYFQKRNVMSFNGQFARGTLGAVRALTDPDFRDQNEAYLRERFGQAREWSLLTKVQIAQGQPITPAWSTPDTLLYTWPERQATRG